MQTMKIFFFNNFFFSYQMFDFNFIIINNLIYLFGKIFLIFDKNVYASFDHILII